MLHCMLLADSEFPYNLFSKLSADISSLFSPQPPRRKKMQPITVHIPPIFDPNAWTPVLLLEVLKVKYELRLSPDPTGRKQTPFKDTDLFDCFPAIEDPNTGTILSTTAAITQYLITHYDPSHHLSFDPTTSPHSHNLCTQWLSFQTSHHAPTLSQLYHFRHTHPQNLSSAIQHYTHELERILGVLDAALEGKDWLVGEKMTYADLAFYHWNEEVKGLRGFNDTDNGEGFRGFGNVGAWDRRIRRAVRGSCGYMGAKRMEMKRDGWGETSMEAKGLLAQVEGWNEENRRPLRGPVVRPLGERNEEGDSKGYEDLIMRYTQRRASSRT